MVSRGKNVHLPKSKFLRYLIALFALSKSVVTIKFLAAPKEDEMAILWATFTSIKFSIRSHIPLNAFEFKTAAILLGKKELFSILLLAILILFSKSNNSLDLTL